MHRWSTDAGIIGGSLIASDLSLDIFDENNLSLTRSIIRLWYHHDPDRLQKYWWSKISKDRESP